MSVDKSLRILTLNVEKDKHLEVQLGHLRQEQYDVVMLQEVPEDTVTHFAHACHAHEFEWIPVQDIRGKACEAEDFNRLGIAIITRQEHMVNPSSVYYASFHAPYKAPEVLTDTKKLVHVGAMFAPLTCGLVLATTHGCWTKDGDATPDQLVAIERLLWYLDEYRDSPVVLTGDFNAPRGREAWDMLSAEFTDNVPVGLTTTIDNDFHYSGKNLQVVVDGIFTRNATATDVRVHTGLSDHYGLSAVVQW